MTTDTTTAGQKPRAYDADYYGWIEDQVALIEAGRLAEIDTQNIAEEIRSIATRQYDHLENAARALIYNLLKWDLQPDRRSKSMVFSIDAHRDQIAVILGRNPSIVADLAEAIVDAYLYATHDMMRDSDLPRYTFAPDCPYDWDTICNRPVEFDGVASPSRGEYL